MSKYECTICGYVYDESAGIPEKGIAPGTKWVDLPDDFACPLCTAPKSAFTLLDEGTPASSPVIDEVGEHFESLKKLSPGEISAICSSLAKGCEKQRLAEEMAAFQRIADYFKKKTAAEANKTLSDVSEMLLDDIQRLHATASHAVRAAKDRGALRALVWSEKVCMMNMTLLNRYAKEGDAMLADKKIWVCSVCGFIYIGDVSPEVCPVCKVPRFKIEQVERR